MTTYHLLTATGLWLGIGLFEWALWSLVYWFIVDDFWLMTEGFAEGAGLSADKLSKPVLFAWFFIGVTLGWPVVVCLGIRQITKDIREYNKPI